MAAYVIADVQIKDPERYMDYTAHTPQSIARYGGRWVVRGGTTQVLEGDWDPGRVVVLEFDSVERAREWYESPEYQEIAPMRQRAAPSKVILVEGYTG